MERKRQHSKVKGIGRAVSENVLGEIVRRIVAVAEPDRIILFGSAARGQMGPHSDLDLLVSNLACSTGGG